MPPVSSPGSLAVSYDDVRHQVSRAAHARARMRFRRALTLMAMTLLLPGSAQIAAGSKTVGRIALRVVAGLLVTVVLLLGIGLIFSGFVYWLLANTLVLGLVKYGLMLVALGWAYLFLDAWRLGDPMRLRQKQRLAMVGVNGFLCFAVAGSLLFASHIVTVQRDFIATMFTSDTVTQAHGGRYNVLLLGGDSGKTRWGLRPDSLTVASIDADSGRTVLFGLPRNMQNFTFPEGSTMAKAFPKGYDCDTCELNSLVTWANDHKDKFPGVANPGIEATEQAVEGITGLKINYYAMVNLGGFRKLVDAVGGVTLNVRDRIPKGALGDFDGKSYIEPGRQKLDGADTLWFARSRMAADDYSRMARQKCVMSAMLHQLDPKTVVLNIGKIADAGAAMVETDVPGSELDTFMQLALKSRSLPTRTVSFVPPLVKTYDPDIAKIHSVVEKTIKGEKSSADTKKAVQAAPKSDSQGFAKTKSQTTGGSIGNIKQGYAANQTADLSGSC
ncbi:hypothetical protein GCM10011519_32770 [Marmoricola endophyticus]|uniref:Cell envelope-related transcriptional attenuator domain-containing protein n=1 Tax=Marmoricola endophyticus TaxID=2040280 RepID=A0A917F7R3_9ACTN|nr:LCP family protein [Marmoricola endophyticus]GGF56270.1 hypothetical protein GCM10011519_32770 [Marmoricola endophyticus]